jgi:hypothetical protein
MSYGFMYYCFSIVFSRANIIIPEPHSIKLSLHLSRLKSLDSCHDQNIILQKL